MTGFPKAIAFDLDGTLVDTGPDLTAALNHCLSLEGLPAVSVPVVKDMVGLGARKLLERGLAHHHAAVTAARFEMLIDQFMTFYGSNICALSQPYPGVRACLERFRARGTTMGICTNKPTAMSIALIKALHLEDYFTANLGGDYLPVRKPDAQHLLATLSSMKAHAADTVMVGDSMVDVNAARNAQIPIVAVTFGFSSLSAHAFEADAVIEHFDDLDEALIRAHRQRA
jgi:phosphoglycolate phosphatase